MATSTKMLFRISIGVTKILQNSGRVCISSTDNTLTGSSFICQLREFTTSPMGILCRWQKCRKYRSVLLPGVGVTLAAAGYGLWSWRGHDRLTSGMVLLPSVTAATNISNDGSSNRLKFNFIADVVEKAAPAVVYIEIQGRHPFSGRITAVSNGSGFIVREDGLIVTNAHVVANKQNVVVKLHDGRSLQGKVQAVDEVSDLATVKVEATGLPTLTFGRSASIRPGEWVVALGSPFQLSNTVTAGIISSVHRGSRELGLHHKDMDYIQTDATINFGNSGGPLVNLDGEAIGINTMKVTTGISFAIPSDYASQFLDRAKNIESRKDRSGWFGGTPKLKRRYMGITMLTLTPSISRELKLRMDAGFPDIDHGVLVHKIVVGSPAYSGGIRAGDIITHINDKEVTSAGDVYKAVESDVDLKVTVRRSNEIISLTVTPEHVS